MKRAATLISSLLITSLVLRLSITNGLAAPRPKTYIAHLVPLNSKVTGRKAQGELRVTVSGNKLTFNLNAHGLPPGMMHMTHLHGFISGKAASCPGANADTNRDGIIDLSETEPMAGTTLVPLDGDPAALKIASNTYPVASSSGRISYRKTVSLAQLNSAMSSTYHGASLDLDKRVVFIHGVPESTSLPKTVASLPGVPAQVTLPIACGKLEPAR